MRVHAHEHPSTMPSEKPRRKLKIRRKKGGFEKRIFHSSSQKRWEQAVSDGTWIPKSQHQVWWRGHKGMVQVVHRWFGFNQKCISNLCFYDPQGFQGWMSWWQFGWVRGIKIITSEDIFTWQETLQTGKISIIKDNNYILTWHCKQKRYQTGKITKIFWQESLQNRKDIKQEICQTERKKSLRITNIIGLVRKDCKQERDQTENVINRKDIKQETWQTGKMTKIFWQESLQTGKISNRKYDNRKILIVKDNNYIWTWRKSLQTEIF